MGGKGERKLHGNVSATHTITRLVCAARQLNRRETRATHAASPPCETNAWKVKHATRGEKKQETPTRNKDWWDEGTTTTAHQAPDLLRSPLAFHILPKNPSSATDHNDL